MEKDRINDTEKSFQSGKKRMDKLKVLMKYAGISVFEYFPDSDRMVLVVDLINYQNTDLLACL